MIEKGNETDVADLKYVYKGEEIQIFNVYRGVDLIWEKIFSCYGNGYWINEQPWINEDGWKNI